MAPILYLAKSKKTIYSLVPSLEQMAAVKIATTLWNRTDIRASIDVFDLLDSKTHQKAVEEKVKYYARKLLLSEQARNKVLGVIKPIGEEIYSWIDSFNFDECLPKQLIFTVFGTIDQRKTAQTIVEDSNASLKLRYMFACTYCLEDDVIRLWEELTAEIRESFLDEDWTREYIVEELVKFWSQAMQQSGDLQEKFEKIAISSSYEVVIWSITDCIQAAVKYLLPKLSHWAQTRVFRDCAWCVLLWCEMFPHKCKNEFLCWLFSQMDERQQTAMLAENPYMLLASLLDWPLQYLFLHVVNDLKCFLSNSVFSNLLYNIVYRAEEGYRDYDYQQLVTEFWAMFPETAKRYTMKGFASFEKSYPMKGFGSGCSILTGLFSLGDKKNIKLILNDATIEEMKNIVCCLASQYYKPHDAPGESDARKRHNSLLLLEFVVSEELNKQNEETGNLFKKFCAAC